MKATNGIPVYQYRGLRILSFSIAFLLIILGPDTSQGNEAAYISTHSLGGQVSVKSWKSMRDARIVKQSLDYSCGAAAAATLLSQFYGQSLTETDLLESMEKIKDVEDIVLEDFFISFDDIRRGLSSFGFRAVGYAISYEQLSQLRIPVIVYVEHAGEDHFSVLRGISDNTVWLADPSLGNRTFSREQFMRMWNTRGDGPDAHLEGRILAILPDDPEVAVFEGFFTRNPMRQTAGALRQLMIRSYP